MNLESLEKMNSNDTFGLLVESPAHGLTPIQPGTYEPLSQWLYLKQQQSIGQKNLHCTRHVKNNKKCELCQKKFKMTLEQQLITMIGKEDYEENKNKEIVYSRIERTETGHIFLAPFNSRAKKTVEWTIQHACKTIEQGAYHRLSNQHFQNQCFPGNKTRSIGEYVTIECDYG